MGLAALDFCRRQGWSWSGSTARTVRPAAGRVSPTRSTPRPPRGLPRPAGPAVSRRPAAGRSTRCARCGWPAAPREDHIATLFAADNLADDLRVLDLRE